MRRVSTNFLRFVLVIGSLAVLAFLIFALPSIYNGGSAEFPYASQALLVIISIFYVTGVPFYFAVVQVFKLLSYIDKNIPFSEQSVKAIRMIKYCAVAMTILYWICVPFLFPIADGDDAPGLLLFGAAFACTPIVVAVFAAVLQRLLQSVIDIKSENDLTV